MAISAKAKEKIMGDVAVRAALMKVFLRSEKCITNWADSNDKKLSTKTAVDVLVEETGLTKEEILEPEIVNY